MLLFVISIRSPCFIIFEFYILYKIVVLLLCLFHVNSVTYIYIYICTSVQLLMLYFFLLQNQIKLFMCPYDYKNSGQ